MTRTPVRWMMAVVMAMAAACVQTDGDPGAGADTGALAEPVNAVREAVWSADGRRLAVTWTQGSRTRWVGLFGPVDGGAPEAGSGLPMADGEAGWGSWAPDGLWVAYAAGAEGAREVHRSRPDGMEPENLTGNPADDFDPAYSPDGRTIAFVSNRDGGTAKLHAMDADGENPRLLADLGGPVRRPMWSPDGSRLAVQVLDRGEDAIYVVNADGTGSGRVGTGSFPAWSPDGETVLFTENDSLFWRPAAGGSRRLLVADGRMGRPSPSGDWVAFVRGPETAAGLFLLRTEDGAQTRITPP